MVKKRDCSKIFATYGDQTNKKDCSVRVADRLTIFLLSHLAHLHIYWLADYHAYILIDLLLYSSVTLLCRRSRSNRSNRGCPRPPTCGRHSRLWSHTAQVGLQAIPTDHVHPLPHLQLPGIVAPLQYLVGATVLVRHGPQGPPLAM